MTNPVIQTMMQRYSCENRPKAIRALREVIQDVALVGLWRGKFFEHAAFYGGTALRILYHLDRFSEDLDFSLLKPNPNFSLDKYNQAIKAELASYGFEVEVETKEKNVQSKIESAFIKGNTQRELLTIGIPKSLVQAVHGQQLVKVKLEVDTDPPQGFETEVKKLDAPLSVSILSYIKPDLFAGKMHAVLCRQWKQRVKGRDWYDLDWFVRHQIPINLNYLERRMWQSGNLEEGVRLSSEKLIGQLHEKIDGLDLESAKDDIRKFVEDKANLSLWSKDYFHDCADRIKFH